MTAADKKAEKSIHYMLQNAPRIQLPDGRKRRDRRQGSDEFIVDPLDGTNNFLHGVPHWCITIAAEIDGEITDGIVFDVVRNEMFWASKGVGAFIRNRKIRVTSRTNLEDGLVGTGTPAQGPRRPRTVRP